MIQRIRDLIGRYRYRYELRRGLPGARWEIWLVSSLTGNGINPVATYDNRGHAIARLRGLTSRLAGA